MADTKKALSVTLTVGGDEKNIFRSCTVDHGVFQDGSRASVIVSSLSGISEGDELVIEAGWDGSTGMIFNGRVGGMKRSRAEGGAASYELIGYDLFKRLSYTWSNGDRTYVTEGMTTATDTSTARNWVEMCGISSGDASIEGDDWEIGTVEAIVFANGDVPLQAIRKLDEATPNFVTFARRDGKIYRRPITLGSYSSHYTSADIISGERTTDESGVVNSVKVTGRATFGVPNDALEQDDSAYIPDPFKYNTETITNDFVQDPTHAIVTAAGTLARKNILQDDGSITVVGDYTANPATTIRITDSILDFSSTDRWVTAVHHEITEAARFTTTFSIVNVGNWDI